MSDSFFSWLSERAGKSPNAEQKDAILVTDGAALVVVGAGTGKTTMITAKAAYRVNEKNLKPERILMLTFSREAARHLEPRIHFTYFLRRAINL